MKRENEIKKAAKIAVINSVDSGMDEETAWVYGFFHGARWADENSNESITKKELNHLFSKSEGDIDFLTFLLTEYFEK